jgi:plasmid stabilization system protein ParE
MRDIYQAVATLVHPLPDRQGFAASNPHLSESDLSSIFDDVYADAARERERYVEELRQQAESAAERDEEFDPLLDELARCRAQILEMERRIGLLLAYGREFVRPQPYQLKTLAAAAGLSISGVRIAYDDDEVGEVEQILGEKPRRPAAGGRR